MTSLEDAQTERNVLQLHSAETEERDEEISVPEESSIEATDNLASTEDSFESTEIYTLQLHKEDVSIVSDDIAPDESDLERIEVKDPSSTVAEGDEVSFEEETDEEDDIFTEQLDEEEETSVSFLSDSEDFIEVQHEEAEIKDMFVADSDRIVIDDSDQDFTEGREEEMYGVEEGMYIDSSEEMVFEGLEVDESEEEEEFNDNEMNEDEYLNSDGIESAPYSWEVEMQNANFLSRFLVNSGLEQLLMFAIVLTEWIRVYIFTPVYDSIVWAARRKGLLQLAMDTRGGGLASVMNTRGGAIASLPSESENDDQTDEGETTEDIAPSAEDQFIENDENIKSESNSLQELDEQDTEQDSEQDDLLKSGMNITKTTPEDVPSPVPRKLPPNFIFRRLLNYGFVGHLLIMEIILASEWLNLYVPQIQKLAHYIVYDLLKQEKKFGYGSGKPENYMTSGFVNIGEGSRLPKKSRKQKRKEDQRALDQLKSVGNVNEAKYRFISQNFMKRHRLGPYKVAVAEIELDNEVSKKDAIEEKEAESDSGWILNALGVEEEDTDSPLDAEFGISIGSEGPSVSVGFEYTIGKKNRRTQSLRSVIVESTSNKPSSKRKKTRKPHVSDSESGIMGRLRAQGANSLVGRSILGAYPGDLPPPDEAADARGVIDIARRYGYGDWSDEDENQSDEYYLGGDEDDENSMEDLYEIDQGNVRPRKRSARKTKRRRSSSSRNKENVELGLNLDLSRSSRDQDSFPNVSRRKSASSLSSSVATSASSPKRRRRRKPRSSRLPSLAMETLGGSSRSQPASKKTGGTATITKRTVATTNVDSKEILRNSAAETIRKRKTRTKRPAMSILDKTRNASDTVSQKDDQ